jgi:two-component system sensor histidine kinase EvgS
LPKGERDLLAAASSASQSLRSLLNRALDFRAWPAALSSRMRNPAMQPSSAGNRWMRSGHRPSGGPAAAFDCPGHPRRTSCDADALRQIASNLLATQ